MASAKRRDYDMHREQAPDAFERHESGGYQGDSRARPESRLLENRDNNGPHQRDQGSHILIRPIRYTSTMFL